MKYLAAVVISLLMGFALGGWGPREDVRKLREDVREARRKGPSGQLSEASLAGITRMLNVPDEGEVPKAVRRKDKDVPSQDPLPTDGTNTSPAEATEPAREQAPQADPDRPEPAGRWEEMSPEERMEEAIELWNLRSDLARNSFLTNAGAKEDEALRFDVLIEAMNLRIETSIAEWAGLLQDEAIAPPEAAVRMMHDISGAIAMTYDEFDRSMPEAWRSGSGEEFKMFDFIDPRVATPLMGMEDRFDFE